jgi:hypothetical protein
MARWTNWRKIADKSSWNGPACYELAIGGPRGGNITIVYVGETANERKRVSAYASHGSHLAEIIRWHLQQGWHLFYHAQAKNSKQEAVCMQNNLLTNFKYDWNIQLNR